MIQIFSIENILSQILLILMKKRYYLLLIGLSLTIFLFYFYLWNTDRNPPYRGVYMLWLSSCVYLLYSIDTDRIKTIWSRYAGKKKSIGIFVISILVMSIIGFRLSSVANYGIINYSKFYLQLRQSYIH